MVTLGNVKISGYGNYSSGNYGLNAVKVSIGSTDFYFSYETLIAFRDNGKLYILKNCWGTTTGKHLNAISEDKSIRLDSETFDKAADEMLTRRGY